MLYLKLRGGSKMDYKYLDLQLFSGINELFNKNNAELNNNTIAAIITSASKMAINSNIATPEETSLVLQDLYQVTNNEEVLNLIGMPESYAKTLIGYAVNYNDYTSSTIEYNTHKEQYDKFYKNIVLKAKLKEQTNNITR